MLADIRGDVTGDIIEGTLGEDIIDAGAGGSPLFGGPDIWITMAWIPLLVARATTRFAGWSVTPSLAEMMRIPSLHSMMHC